jgi:phage gp36-like protein
MPYATATDLITRFSAKEIAQRADRAAPRVVSEQLLKDAAAGVSLAAYSAPQQAAVAEAMTIIQRALDDARDTIDSHISSRYALPVLPVPPILGRIACNLARRYLYDDQVTELVKSAYDDDMRQLREVRDGKASLGADAATNQQPTSNAGAELTTGVRVWGRDASRGFL